LNQSPLLLDYEAGKISTEAFFERVRKESGFKAGFEEFSRDFSDIFQEAPPMVAVHRELKAAGWRTYLFSNTNELAIRHIKNRFPFYSDFDGHVLSYQHQSLKPEARLYEVVEEMTECRGASIFYIDDRLENIEAGKARHWQVHLHESPEKTLPILNRLVRFI
jgi:HAD superfamily hydrolase (TIGR01509 family)